jgi:hypothetical protein
MGRILDLAVNFLMEDEWPCMQTGDAESFKTGFFGEHAEFSCLVQERVEEEQFLFYSILPIKIPAEKRMEAAEFITRANSGMAVGNFEMDFADGEIRYKTSVDLEDVDIADRLVRNLIYANVLTLDRYIPGIMRMVYGGISPIDAIREVEGE